MSFLKIITPVLLAAFYIGGCQKDADRALDQATHPLLKIRTVVVQSQNMVDTLFIYGHVAFREETILSSQFEGRLSDFSLLIGDRLHKGQKIATIIPPQREALMQIFERVSADSRQILESEIKTIDLHSPIDGIVVTVWRRGGDVVQRGEKILHIGDPRILQILADMPVKMLPAIRRNQQLTVLFPASDLPKTSLAVAAVSPDVSPTKQTVLLRMNLPNPDGIYRPGMLVKIGVPAQRHSDALTVPRSAVLEEEGMFSVYVLKGNLVEKRTVMPGIMQKDRIEITAGLTVGEKVAVEKVYSLINGMEVQP